MVQKLWVLDSPTVRSAIWDVGNKWKKSDDNCGQPFDTYVSFGGPASRISDLRAVLTANTIPDFAWTIPDCLVQQKIVEIFEAEGFTGFETRNAEVRWEPKRPRKMIDDADLVKLASYRELIVTGWGGVAREESGVKRISGSNVWEGYPDWTQIVDWDAWDGSDFFIVWPFAFARLVTDRVAKLIRKHKMTGVRLISLEDYSHMYRQLKLRETMPMRMQDHFPEAKAREIGELLLNEC